MKTTIYIEGGGNTNKLHSELRQGFQKLFESAGFLNKLPRVIACGTRNDAFNDFKTALKLKKDNEIIILLVDSEDIPNTSTKWEFVKSRDSWIKPQNATEENLYFMVVTMESWFLADADGLSRFFGQKFDDTKLPKNTNLENINKKMVYDALRKATKNTSKGEYGKGSHSFKILTCLDAQRIKNHGKYSKEFFDYLERKL